MPWGIVHGSSMSGRIYGLCMFAFGTHLPRILFGMRGSTQRMVLRVQHVCLQWLGIGLGIAFLFHVCLFFSPWGASALSSPGMLLLGHSAPAFGIVLVHRTRVHVWSAASQPSRALLLRISPWLVRLMHLPLSLFSY